MGKIDVWTMHKSKRILVTDEPGVPVEVTGYVSPEAAAAAQARGYATISEIGFNKSDHFTSDDWGQAQKYAEAKAKELGYTVDVHSIFEAWADFDEDDDYDGEYDDSDQEWDDNSGDWVCAQLGHELELLNEEETENLYFCIHCDQQIRLPRESDAPLELDGPNPFLDPQG